MKTSTKLYVALIITLFPLLIFMNAPAFAKSGKGIPMTPTGYIYPGLGKTLFPAFAIAAGVNPAALGRFKKASAIALAYSSPYDTYTSDTALASFAHAKRGFGMGFGALGMGLNTSSAFGAFGGMGFQFEQISLGVAIRKPILSLSGTPNVDFGFILGEKRGINFGVVLYQIEASSRMNLALGYSAGKKYNLEVDVLLPTFSDLTASGATYRLTIAASIFIGSLSFDFQTGYTTGIDEFSHTLAMSLWLSEVFNLGIQFTTPNIWTVGLGLSF